MRQITAIACVAFCGMLWLRAGLAHASGPAQTSTDRQDTRDAGASTVSESSAELSTAAGTIFGRVIQPGICSDYVIPFEYADRPTISVTINGATRPVLFDTGTNNCLLQLNQSWTLPPRMALMAGAAGLAELDGKRLSLARGGSLAYAVAPLVRLGGVRLRQVPWRVYTVPGAGADYAGAFAPVLLRQWLIEVNNSAAEIRLHPRATWLPPAQAYMLPVLILPRGVFVPLRLEGEQLWFHMDTGFSGGIGLVPAVQARHSGLITPVPDAAEAFQGWHADYEYERLILSQVTLAAYPGLSWAEPAPLTLSAVAGLAYRDAYGELEGYGIGGIAGSGFWQRFDYVLDYELGRLYLWPRADWEEPEAEV